MEYILVFTSFILLFGLLFLRVPISVAMIIIGVTGFTIAVDAHAAFNLLRLAPIRTFTDQALALIPLFILMGTFATYTGFSSDLFNAAHKWVGHLKGGMALSTIIASAGFGAICGSSVAGAATMTRIALPELRARNYADTISSGVIAAGGTLGIMIPPSVMLAVYGIITNVDIGRLFIAAIIPGVLAAIFQILVVAILANWRPNQMPAAPSASWAQRLSALKKVWTILVIFASVIGGMYAGWFTPTEAAAVGAGSVFLVALVERKLNLKHCLKALDEAVKISANIFLILVGAVIFGYFLAITQTPQSLASLLTSFDWPPFIILTLILLAYIILGCFLDSLALLVLTVPIVHPIIIGLGYDPVWFGVLLAVTVGIGLTSPPMGLNIFVIQSAAKDLNLKDIYKGVLPFLFADIARLALLASFPAITLFLPNTIS